MTSRKKTARKAVHSSGTTAPMLLVLAALAILSALVLIVLYQLNVLPVRYFAAVCLLVVVLLLVLFLLLRDFHPGFRCILGVLLAFLYAGGMIYGGVILKQTSDTLDAVSQDDVNYSISNMVVYVRSDDSASTLDDVAGYTFGIMTTQNRDVTDQAVTEIESQLNAALTLYGYDGPASLVKGLLNGDVDAILFNSVFFDIVSSMDNYTDLSSQLRAVTTLSIKIQSETSQEKESQEESSVFDPISGDHTLTLYISGSDEYGTVSTTGRSDVNILAVVNTETKQIALISTPRDFYVEFPNSYGEPDKLTHACAYGIDNAVGTMEMLYDTDIDYYFRVNFSGFEEIIDAIGGITIDNDIAFTSDADNNNFYFEEGEITLNGEEALSYVRCRHAFTDGDNERGRHQMMVIEATLKKLMSAELLKNFSTLLDAVSGSFATDMPTSVMTSLVKMQLEDMTDWNIVQYAASGWNDSGYSWSAGEELSVVDPDPDTVEAAKELIRQVHAGETVTLPTTGSSSD